jgi:hypothetical protein
MSEAQSVELAQPQELFDESMLPDRSDLVEMVKGRSFLREMAPDRARFSGKIVIRQMLNDEELCEAVCTAILAGLSARLIGKRFGLSPRSVANIRDAMADRGELAPVRTRIQRKLDRVTELGLECVEDGLLRGEIHPGQAWIPVLATVDKREQLAVGMVPGTERTVAGVTLEQVLAEHAAAKAKAASPDRRSEGTATQPVDVQSSVVSVSPLDTALDTGRALPEPASSPALAAFNAARQAALVPAAAAAVDGAGGVASP